ncbi:MAG: hypothetical protein WA414_08270, partial [Acidobacteriaceae bacterium]
MSLTQSLRKEGKQIMQSKLLIVLSAALCAVATAQSQSTTSCAEIANIKLDGVEITKASPVAAGAMVPVPYAG